VRVGRWDTNCRPTGDDASAFERKEVIAVELQKWETPEFEEIGTSAEVTAYAGIWPDSE
jgi:coenzyme PQQ precursor peptide PqqA